MDCKRCTANHRRTAAFTLIELLIVVAIIAILAAIAVPNFLEAQTRAKVSAAKNELRVVALGLESYAVDHNRYPYTESIGPSIFMPPGGTPRLNLSGAQCGGLTSPVAYLTSIPFDPFKHPIAGIPVTAPVYYERAGLIVRDGMVDLAGPSLVPSDVVGTSNLDGASLNEVAITDERRTPAPWVLYSLGPDLDNEVRTAPTTFITRSRYSIFNRYDPTNGSISPGNIVRYPGGLNFP